jgi:thiol-disulfide isomerase/thioredoxin
MARTPTTQIPLGFKAPDFVLTDTVTGKNYTLPMLKGNKGTVVMFICNHCPFVVHVREEILSIARHYLPKGIGFVAISSNDAAQYPDDAPDKMAELAQSENFPFPYLYDESQQVAKAYAAACTPDFSVFDENLICVYRGQMDDSRPGNQEPVNGKDLRHVLDCLIEKKTIPSEQKPSLGCNIKWKA